MTQSETQSGVELVPINSVRYGDKGDVVLMMHGWGLNLDSMRILGELLGKWNQVIIVDLPGFGKSPKPDADWDTIQYAERMAKYIDEQNISPAHLIGHSFGGRVAIRMASRFPDRVKSVVLINAHGLQRQLTGKRKWKSMRTKFLSKTCKFIDGIFGTKIYLNWFTPKFGSSDYLNAGPMKNIMVKAVTEDVTPDAQKVQAPTFMLYGEKDDETPVEFGQRYKALIKNSQLVVLPGKDHFPFMDEGAHVCASYILKFFRSLDATASSSAPTERVK
ncbi:MAG TPA: alpha/beta hydrolase [Drouetiella sp.]|jgi:pimeloyl-ACP methyl ester carboxylesterase